MSSSEMSATLEPGTARYSTVALALHWLIAAGVAVQIGLGWYMGSLEDRVAEKAVERIHIALGLSVLLLTLVRLGWRLGHRPPAEPASMARWERIAASLVHKLFYALLLLLPLSGWFMESIGPRPIPFWGLVWPHMPGVPGVLAGMDTRAVKDTVETVHGSPLVWTMIGLVVLHVLGALKHQFDGSPVLWRMVPFMRKRG